MPDYTGEVRVLRGITGFYSPIGGGSSITVDDELSTTSENPVQNKVITVALNGKQSGIVKGSITLSSSNWAGNGPYTQAVTITGTTINSKIDLQPDATALAQLITDGVTALWIQNNAGTLTAYALGAAPTETIVVQYTRTEVST